MPRKQKKTYKYQAFFCSLLICFCLLLICSNASTHQYIATYRYQACVTQTTDEWYYASNKIFTSTANLICQELNGRFDYLEKEFDVASSKNRQNSVSSKTIVCI